MKLTERIDENTQTIGELWESMADFCNGRVEDNEKYNGEYPLEIRKTQMETLKCLISCIDEIHEKNS